MFNAGDLIYSMSRTRHNLSILLMDYTHIYCQHLLMCFFWPDSPSFDHWVKEISGYMSDVPTMAGTHKLPSASFIYKNIFGDEEDSFHRHYKNWCKRIQMHEGKEIEEAPILEDLVHAFLKDYFEFYSDTLSKNGSIFRDDIKNQITHLLKKYGRVNG